MAIPFIEENLVRDTNNPTITKDTAGLPSPLGGGDIDFVADPFITEIGGDFYIFFEIGATGTEIVMGKWSGSAWGDFAVVSVSTARNVHHPLVNIIGSTVYLHYNVVNSPEGTMRRTSPVSGFPSWSSETQIFDSTNDGWSLRCIDTCFVQVGGTWFLLGITAKGGTDDQQIYCRYGSNITDDWDDTEVVTDHPSNPLLDITGSWTDQIVEITPYWHDSTLYLLMGAKRDSDNVRALAAYKINTLTTSSFNGEWYDTDHVFPPAYSGWDSINIHRGAVASHQGRTYLIYDALQDPVWRIGTAFLGVNKQVVASIDDGHGRQDCEGLYPSGDFAAIGNVSGSDIPVDAFFRFTGIDIPAGSTIISAVLTVISERTISATTVNSNIKAEKSSNPAAPTTCADLVGRTRTTAFVAWDSIGTWTIDVEYDSPDITSVIQELFDLGYLTGEKSLMIIIEDDGSTVDIFRPPSTYDRAVAKAARINIVYVEPFNLSVTDGLKSGDTLANLDMVASITVADGVKAGDTLSQLMTVSLLVTEGLKGGDALSPIGMLSLADGVKLGEVLSLLSNLALTDGTKLGDTESVLASLGITDGLKLGDTFVLELITLIYYLTLTDGGKFGDTESQLMTAGLSLTDGVKLGDALSQLSTISVSIADGTKFGDTNVAELTGVGFYLYLTEGLKLGDSPLVSFLANLQLSDGTKLGDSELLSMVANLLDTEGIKIGDTITLSGLIYLLSLTDGIKLGDTDAVEAVMNLSLSDGTKFGDIELRELVGLLVTLTDGIKLGDSSALSVLMSLILSDGVKLGELISTLTQLSLTDGVKAGDTASILSLLQMMDGVKFGDNTALEALMNFVLTDGLKLGDSVALLGRLVKLWLFLKTIHDLRVFTEPYHNVIIWAGEEDMTIRRNWQRGETIRIWAEVKLTSTNELYDPDQGVVLYVYDPDGTVLAAINGEAMTNDSTGMYYYDWNSASDSDIGWYRAKGKAQDGTGAGAKVTIENGGFELGV